jgi:hypothetical protein
MVLVEVASVVTGKNLDECNTRDLRRPSVSTAKFSQTCSLPGERRDAAAVENQVHAL